MSERINLIRIESITNIWANNKIVRMCYDQSNGWYQAIKLKERNGEAVYTVSPMEQNTTNSPILIKGIIAFLIRRYGKSEKEIFEEYYHSCLSTFKNVESIKPGSSQRNLDREFYSIHHSLEKDNIDFSQKLKPYLGLDEMDLLNQYADSYLSFIKSTYGPNHEHDQKSTGLSVYDWSIVFYYLYSANAITGVKIRQMEQFIIDNRVVTPTGDLATSNSFKNKEYKMKNRINGKENKYGEIEWSDKFPPLPPSRIKKILPFIKKSKVALQTAKDDIERLRFEVDKYKENHYKQ